MSTYTCIRFIKYLNSLDFRLNIDWSVRLCGSVATQLRNILAKEQLDQVQKFLAVTDALNVSANKRYSYNNIEYINK